ncbi:MAG TPA: HAD family hydrolase [Candidatus Xenobia bacterium]|nr:HAD family hydrolase [Candidatus Xenobia bacterium]
MKKPLPKAILFDLDGTLLDSFEPHYRAFRATLARFGIRLTRRRFLQAYSPDWRETYRAMGLPRELWDEASVHWREFVRTHPPRLLPGARETLRCLRKNFRLGVVTGGSRKRVMNDLRRTRIRRFFDTVVCGDDVVHRKPSPQGLHIALRALRAKPRQALYVGDTEVDRVMARKARVPFIGIVSPFMPRRARAPYTTLRRASELVPLLHPAPAT